MRLPSSNTARSAANNEIHSSKNKNIGLSNQKAVFSSDSVRLSLAENHRDAQPPTELVAGLLEQVNLVEESLSSKRRAMRPIFADEVACRFQLKAEAVYQRIRHPIEEDVTQLSNNIGNWRIAHRLMGDARLLSLAPLAAVAALLEEDGRTGRDCTPHKEALQLAWQEVHPVLYPPSDTNVR